MDLSDRLWTTTHFQDQKLGLWHQSGSTKKPSSSIYKNNTLAKKSIKHQKRKEKKKFVSERKSDSSINRGSESIKADHRKNNNSEKSFWINQIVSNLSLGKKLQRCFNRFSWTCKSKDGFVFSGRIKSIENQSIECEWSKMFLRNCDRSNIKYIFDRATEQQY